MSGDDRRHRHRPRRRTSPANQSSFPRRRRPGLRAPSRSTPRIFFARGRWRSACARAPCPSLLCSPPRTVAQVVVSAPFFAHRLCDLSCVGQDPAPDGCPFGGRPPATPAAPQGRPQPPKRGQMPHGPHLWRPVTVGSHSPQYRIPIAGFSTCEEGSYGRHTFSPSTQWSHRDFGNREGHSALLLRSLWCLAPAVRTRCAPDAPITVSVFSTGARRKQCAQGLC